MLLSIPLYFLSKFPQSIRSEQLALHRGEDRSPQVDLVLVAGDVPLESWVNLDVYIRRASHNPRSGLRLIAFHCRRLDLIGRKSSKGIDESNACAHSLIERLLPAGGAGDAHDVLLMDHDLIEGSRAAELGVLLRLDHPDLNMPSEELSLPGRKLAGRGGITMLKAHPDH